MVTYWIPLPPPFPIAPRDGPQQERWPGRAEGGSVLPLPVLLGDKHP